MRSLIQRSIQRLGRDPGLAYLALALVAVVALYAPTLGRGLVNYDDPWLYTHNTVLHHPSWAGVATVFTDLDSPQRFQLSPEYLPIRDLSVMADYAIWGEHLGGFHLTNLAIYLAAIAIWFAALTELGIARPIAGLALLVWAVHPSHAESVAWLAERKGVLGMMWAGTCALGYARFRAGRSAWWLVLAATGGVCAVWSKAIAAFAVGALGPLELALPERRVTWRRSLAGLATIAVTTGLAYVPVVVLAIRWSIVGGASAPLPASRLITVIGVHGFYLRLAAGTIANAVSYPIAIAGPSALELVVGGLGFAAVIAALVRGSPVVRAAAIVWLFGWLPVGHLLLPLQMVVVADRYLLVPSLGFALAIAAGLAWISRPRLRLAAIAAVVVALALRALAAQAAWATDETLWQQAIVSNPDDGSAWAMYVEALDQDGHRDEAARVIDVALAHSRLPRLVLHAGLVALREGRGDDALALFREAATRGDPRAMANLANMLAERGQLAEALRWARYATTADPSYANGHRIRGKVARLAEQHSRESLHAFERAYRLEPDVAIDRYNLGIAYADAGRTAEARALLASCLPDRGVGELARRALAHL
ncbi:MAG: tetratricopeptide repeat protein [Kofleriaceae bacterium]